MSALGSTLEVSSPGRVLQGAGGGIFPLCFAIIRDEFPREKVSSSIGLISATFGIGGGAGLIIGGVLVDGASYHWIFWLGAAMAAAAAVLTQLLIPESPNRSPGPDRLPRRRRARRRPRAAAAGDRARQRVGLGQRDDARADRRRRADPGRLGRRCRSARRSRSPTSRCSPSPPVLMTNIATLLVGFGMFGSFILIPQLAEAPESTGYGFGLSATGAGLLMLPGALVMLVAGPFAGRARAPLRRPGPARAGALIVSATGLPLMGLDHGSQGAMVAWNLILSLGIGLAFAAMPNLIFDAVPQSETGEATGFNTLVRSVGASLGSQISAAILTGSVVAGAVLPTDDALHDRVPASRPPSRSRPRWSRS